MHFYTNRNYFNDAKTHIEQIFLNECKAIFKHVFEIV
jgi:hypothetical protein